MDGTSTCRVKVEAGGTGVAFHVGLHAFGYFADRLGLSGALYWRSRNALLSCTTAAGFSSRRLSYSRAAGKAVSISSCRAPKRRAGP